MIVIDAVGTESHPVYQRLSIENLDRQYSFLKSAVTASIDLSRPMLSIEVIKALNYHAICCLHAFAGEFRPCQVTVGKYVPPPHYQVPGLMNMLINDVNRTWEASDPVQLAAYVLWRLNLIHPFLNANGRTARVASYFVLCLRLGGWLPGRKLLPELLVANKPEYVAALQTADAAAASGVMDLSDLLTLLSRLLDEQLASAGADGPAAAAP